jgi:alkylation response protein AidB-like acyl-CoA dehydrogenase
MTELPALVATVAAGAAARDADRSGAFPEDAIAALQHAGVLAGVLPYAEELALLRTVGAADAGVARIVDGHLNAVERLRVQAPPPLAGDELAAIARGELRAGVWGADPGPGEGDPARLRGDVVSGVKTFCSGAGGLQRALVLVRDGEGPPLAAWLDLTQPGTVEVDRVWFRGAGMLSSASHRVVFHETPVLAVLGKPGALTLQPWFARDAVRTAATWAGAADAAVEDALDRLAGRPGGGDLEALAAGRLLTWQAAIGLWLARAAAVLDGEPEDQRAADVAAQARVGIADAARAILDEAERALGSRPGATGAALDRAARDLRLFLLQHRLEPILARTGAAALEARR